MTPEDRKASPLGPCARHSPVSPARGAHSPWPPNPEHRAASLSLPLPHLPLQPSTTGRPLRKCLIANEAHELQRAGNRICRLPSSLP